MKVVVDVLGAPAQAGGMRLYAEEVVRSWVTVAPQDRLLVVGDGWVRDAFAHLPGVVVRCIPSSNPLARSLGQLLAVPLVFWMSGADAVLSLSPVVTPLVPRRARTCVVHDWRHVKNPHEFSRAQRAYRTLWRRSVRWAGQVATISVKTERETQALVPGARTTVVENGRDHARRWDLRTAEPPPGGTRSVVTFGHHPNKRPELVIDAVAALTPERQSRTVLVVLGARGDHARALRARASRAGLAAELHLPGFVPPSEYERLVATAGVVVLASSDEGFGLPVTEAEFFGIPVVGTTDSGLAEVHASSTLRVVEPRAADLARQLETDLARPLGPARPTDPRSWDDVARALRALIAPDPSRRTPVVALGILVGLLPAGPAKNWLLNRTGHSVHPSAQIHPVLILGSTLEVGPRTRIGPLNAFRGLRRVVVGADAEIGQLNWFSAADFLVGPSTSATAGMLVLGPHSSVTNRHYIDASGGVRIGAFATLAGVRSVVMTHGIDHRDNVLDTAPVEVGDHAMVGGNAKLVPGAVVPDRSVIAMGSVVIRGLVSTDTLYAGSPASPKGSTEGAAYMRRTVGKVPPRAKT